MCDCFPASGGGIALPEHCQHRTGTSDYAEHFKQWSSPVVSESFTPKFNPNENDVWKQRYSFSKGPRFGVPPCCDCTPPVERSRFESVYNRDFNDCIFNDPATRRHRVVDGVQPQFGTLLPKQFLCPFTTETSYARAFDMPQKHFNQVCSLQEPCGGCTETPCDDDQCENPCGIEIRYSPHKIKRPQPKLVKDNLIKPGTDTSDCCRCPKPIPCCPCPEDHKTCDACCGCEYPCKIHMAAAIPARKYPIVWNTPRYVPDPRLPPRRPKLLCAGGTRECPIQNQFPTQQAIKQAKYRLMEKLERERCKYPPECLESLYRSSYRFPPFSDVPKYCSIENQKKARAAQAEQDAKGFPPKCLPYYCLDGGKPADTRPPWDHFSTYQADFIWDWCPRFRLMGGEIPCQFEIKPMCCPTPLDACEVIKQRTEEKERWGEDWECCPPPAE